ncbi:MAG: signal peptidase II [Acidimicrobiia bacterium]|nr:signal peptidase II [Acidimicrobiia bacterium]
MRTTSLKAVRVTAAAIGAAVVLVDQLTKAWARSALADRVIEVIPEFLRFALAENSGAAFGLFKDGGQIIAVLAVVAVMIIFISFRAVDRRADVIGLGLVLGGAIGNLVDRLTRGSGLLDGRVTDFIDLWFIPNFNVADASISVGVALLLLGALRRP